MHSCFLWRCIHRQTSIMRDVPNQKKITVIDGPPLCIQMCSSGLKSMQILPMSCHGSNLKLWCDIGRFFLLWGYIEISPNNAFMGIIKIGQQPWTWPQLPWIHQFFNVCIQVNHPNFIAQHSQTTQMWQCDKISSQCLFFNQKLSPG
jgi:hypothetical protein